MRFTPFMEAIELVALAHPVAGFVFVAGLRPEASVWGYDAPPPTRRPVLGRCSMKVCGFFHLRSLLSVVDRTPPP